MLHGWIYDLADDRLHDLHVSMKEGAELEKIFTQALAAARTRHALA